MEPWQFGPSEADETLNWPPSFASQADLETELQRAFDECPEFKNWILTFGNADGCGGFHFKNPLLRESIGTFKTATYTVNELKRMYVERVAQQVFHNRMEIFLIKKKIEQLLSDPNYSTLKHKYEQELKAYNDTLEFRKQAGIKNTRDLRSPSRIQLLVEVEKLQELLSNKESRLSTLA